MMRWLAFAVAALAISPAARSQEKPASSKSTPPKEAIAKPKTIPNPAWTPKPGDTAEVIADETPACLNENVFLNLAKSMQAKDRVGVDKVLAGRYVTKLPKGVRVLVLQARRPDRSGGGGVTSTGAYLDS